MRGALPLALLAAQAGMKRIVLPAANAPEAALVPGIEVGAAASLAQVLDWLGGKGALEVAAARGPQPADGGIAGVRRDA